MSGLFILPRARIRGDVFSVSFSCRMQESGRMSSPAKALTARQFFSKHGLLSRWHPRYEFRPGQLEMAEAVEAALGEETFAGGRWYGHRENACISGTGAAFRQTRDRFHRHQELARAALLQRHSVPGQTFRPAAAGLLHEGPR